MAEKVWLLGNRRWCPQSTYNVIIEEYIPNVGLVFILPFSGKMSFKNTYSENIVAALETRGRAEGQLFQEV